MTKENIDTIRLAGAIFHAGNWVLRSGLWPARQGVIAWNNASYDVYVYVYIYILSVILFEINLNFLNFSLKNKHLSMSSAKWRPFCSGLNVLTITRNIYKR